MTHITVAAFNESFNRSLKALKRSEFVTKEELKGLSRSLLGALHNGPEGLLGDIGYINRLMGVLTPINKQACREYFKHFTGFVFSEETFTFVKKHAKMYDATKILANEFLAEPHNNLWTWAERNIEVSKKEFDINQAGEFFKKFVKKAEKNGLSQMDVVKNILGAGVQLDTILEIMTSMYKVDAEESKIVVVTE